MAESVIFTKKRKNSNSFFSEDQIIRISLKPILIAPLVSKNEYTSPIPETIHEGYTSLPPNRVHVAPKIEILTPIISFKNTSKLFILRHFRWYLGLITYDLAQNHWQILADLRCGDLGKEKIHAVFKLFVKHCQLIVLLLKTVHSLQTLE